MTNAQSESKTLYCIFYLEWKFYTFQLPSKVLEVVSEIHVFYIQWVTKTLKISMSIQPPKPLLRVRDSSSVRPRLRNNVSPLTLKISSEFLASALVYEPVFHHLNGSLEAGYFIKKGL